MRLVRSNRPKVAPVVGQENAWREKNGERGCWLVIRIFFTDARHARVVDDDGRHVDYSNTAGEQVIPGGAYLPMRQPAVGRAVARHGFSTLQTLPKSIETTTSPSQKTT